MNEMKAQERTFLLAAAKIIDAIRTDHESHERRGYKLLVVREVLDQQAWRYSPSEGTKAALAASSMLVEFTRERGGTHTMVKEVLSLASRVLTSEAVAVGLAADAPTNVDEIPF